MRTYTDEQVAALIEAADPFDRLLFDPSSLSGPISLEIDPADVLRLRAALADITKGG